MALPRVTWHPDSPQMENGDVSTGMVSPEQWFSLQKCAETPKPAAFCIFLPVKLSTQHFCQFRVSLRKRKPNLFSDSYLSLLELYQIKCFITKINSLWVCVSVWWGVWKCCSPSKYFNCSHFSPPLDTWFLFFSLLQTVFMWHLFYIEINKHPTSTRINVRRTAGSLFLPVTSYPRYKCVWPLMTSHVYRVHTWKLRGCSHFPEEPGDGGGLRYESWVDLP